MLNRRGFFARTVAAGAAILGIKAVAPVAAPVDLELEYQCYVSRMDVIYGWGREEALKDLHFYSGDQWGVPGKYGRLTAAQRRGNPARLPA